MSALRKVTVAVDAMGGDKGPSITVPAVTDALAKHPDLTIVLVGDADVLKKILSAYPHDAARLILQHASESVEMDELPSQALRNKKDSSMRVAINLVKEGGADACISAGNTGALMATARFVLKTLPGIDRPAIVSTFPTIKSNKSMRMLDLGANVDSSAEDLVQFAVMGSVIASAMDNIARPTVYLLNIGAEEIKGNEQVKQTAQLLSNSNVVNYAGYIEGDAIFHGEADVIVCDGFVGNVALKTTEGVAKMFTNLLKESFMKNVFTKIMGLLVKPILKSMRKRIDPDRYNGAIFLGLNGIVVKSHGGASRQGFVSAIEEAIMGVEKNITELLKSSLPSQGE